MKKNVLKWDETAGQMISVNVEMTAEEEAEAVRQQEEHDLLRQQQPLSPEERLAQLETAIAALIGGDVE